jgi:hypothetical protein
MARNLRIRKKPFAVNPDDVRHLDDAQTGVPNQRTAKSLSLLGTINSQPSKNAGIGSGI